MLICDHEKTQQKPILTCKKKGNEIKCYKKSKMKININSTGEIQFKKRQQRLGVI